METCIWIFILLIPTLLYSSDQEGDDAFAALLSGVDTHAYDNMDALEALRVLYSARRMRYIKGVSFDKDKNAIIARKRSYAKDGSQEWFVSITKYLDQNRQEIKSTTKIIDTVADCFREELCRPDGIVLSELKRAITLFEIRFEQNSERHHYYWQEFSDNE
jgi:uncharacterized protein (DUF2344 family)